jgi:hypothetical protein
MVGLRVGIHISALQVLIEFVFHFINVLVEISYNCETWPRLHRFLLKNMGRQVAAMQVMVDVAGATGKIITEALVVILRIKPKPAVLASPALALALHLCGAVDLLELIMILMALRLLGLCHLGKLEQVPLHRAALWWLGCQGVEEIKNNMTNRFRVHALEEKKEIAKRIHTIMEILEDTLKEMAEDMGWALAKVMSGANALRTWWRKLRSFLLVWGLHSMPGCYSRRR